MSASALRYQSPPDHNEALRERIVALAHRHRRYGAGMIYLKVRQAGELVNHKRVSVSTRRLGCKENAASVRRLLRLSGSPSADLVQPTRFGQWILCLTVRQTSE